MERPRFFNPLFSRLFNLKADRFSNNLTSYDLLKSLAIILMVIDHIGFHFFPDEQWFRVLGRLCIPIWFFLIGYAKTREIPGSILACGLILEFSGMIAGQYIFPLNILFTLMLTRLWIDSIMSGPAMQARKGSLEAFAGMVILLSLFSWHSAMLLEYGTLGMLFAVMGWIVRHKDEIPLPLWGHACFLTFIIGLFVMQQALLLGHLNIEQGLTLIFGTALIVLTLTRFKLVVWSKNSKLLTPFQFLGRNTLEIYVLHILLFRFMSLWLDSERFGFFDYQLAPPAILNIFMLL